MNVPFTLPTTLKKFIAYQERLIGRNLTDGEKEVTVAWLDIFNDVSTGRIDQSSAISRVDRFIADSQDPTILRFMRASRCWLLYAGKGVPA